MPQTKKTIRLTAKSANKKTSKAGKPYTSYGLKDDIRWYNTIFGDRFQGGFDSYETGDLIEITLDENAYGVEIQKAEKVTDIHADIKSDDIPFPDSEHPPNITEPQELAAEELLQHLDGTYGVMNDCIKDAETIMKLLTAPHMEVSVDTFVDGATRIGITLFIEKCRARRH